MTRSVALSPTLLGCAGSMVAEWIMHVEPPRWINQLTGDSGQVYGMSSSWIRSHVPGIDRFETAAVQRHVEHAGARPSAPTWSVRRSW